ncbi:MAG: COQ9 family protein [Alphaproteobacteria bacterium]|nr:COQ9 family protein [Alphaproteobacteria bacterium]
MTQTSGDPEFIHYSTRDTLLQAMLAHAAFDGWNAATLKLASEESGIDAHQAHLACPRGELDLISHWSMRLDEAAETVLASLDLASMKIRDKVTQGVLARLEAIDIHEEAARRARSRLLLPDAGHDASRLVWATSDMIWRVIGDQSTDFNYYSKRTILSGVYASTLAIWLDDAEMEKSKSREFLARRIQNVMDFEKAKFKVKSITDKLPDPTGIFARLRYGFGPRA